MARVDDFNGLKDEVAGMYHARVNHIDQIKNDTANLMAAFKSRDQERAKEVDELQAATQAYVEECTEGSKTRASDVAKMIADLKSRDQERAEEINNLKIEVASLIGGYKAEREEAAAAWKDLIANMSNIRKGAAPAREETTPEKPGEVAKPKKKKTPAKAIKVKQEEAKAVMKEAKKEELELSEKERNILSVVNDNPEGISLPEIANVMEVAYITITRDIKKLMTDGLIKKEDFLYFPA